MFKNKPLGLGGKKTEIGLKIVFPNPLFFHFYIFRVTLTHRFSAGTHVSA
jgi:hypothetical protein